MIIQINELSFNSQCNLRSGCNNRQPCECSVVQVRNTCAVTSCHTQLDTPPHSALVTHSDIKLDSSSEL